MSQARQKAPPSSASLATRVLTLETRLEYVATKEDMQKIKVWMLVGVLGAIPILTSLVLLVIRVTTFE